MKKCVLVATASAFVLALGLVGASAQQTPGTPMAQQQDQQHTQPHQGDREGGMMGRMMGEGGMMGRGMMAEGGMMGQGMMGHHGMMGLPFMQIIFALMDTDGDGTVSLQEFQAAHERIFRAMDANKDGRLTFEEMRAFIHGTSRSATPQQ